MILGVAFFKTILRQVLHAEDIRTIDAIEVVLRQIKAWCSWNQPNLVIF